MQNNYFTDARALDIYSAAYVQDSYFSVHLIKIWHALFLIRIEPRAWQELSNRRPDLIPGFLKNLATEIKNILLPRAKRLDSIGMSSNWFHKRGPMELVKLTLFYSDKNQLSGSVMASPDQRGQYISHMTLSINSLLDPFSYNIGTLPHELGHLYSNFLDAPASALSTRPMAEGFSEYFRSMFNACYFQDTVDQMTNRLIAGRSVMRDHIDLRRILTPASDGALFSHLSFTEAYTHSRLFFEFVIEIYRGEERLKIIKAALFNKKISDSGPSLEELQLSFTYWLQHNKRPRCDNNQYMQPQHPHAFYTLYQTRYHISELERYNSKNGTLNTENTAGLRWELPKNITLVIEDPISTGQKAISLPTHLVVEFAISVTNSVIFISLQQASEYLERKYPKRKKLIGFLLNQIVHPISFASINLARSYINGTARFLVNAGQNSESINLTWYFGSSLASTWVVQAIQYGAMCCLQEGNLKKNINHLFTLLMYFHFLASLFTSEDFKENPATASLGLAVNLLTSMLMQLTANCLLPKQSQKNSDNNESMIEMENLKSAQKDNKPNRPTPTTLLFPTSNEKGEQPIYENISETTRASCR